jgi:hypothetical protein
MTLQVLSAWIIKWHLHLRFRRRNAALALAPCAVRKQIELFFFHVALSCNAQGDSASSA